MTILNGVVFGDTTILTGNYRKEYLEQISKQNADRAAVRAAAKVGRCRLTASTPALNAPMDQRFKP